MQDPTLTRPRKRKPTEGLIERHSRRCRTNDGGACNCEPSYRAWIYDKRAHQKVSKTFAGRGAYAAAKMWRRDALKALEAGTLRADSRATLRQVAEDWLERAKQAHLLTRSGTVYKPSVIRGYETDLRQHVFPAFYDGNVRMTDIRRRDVQQFVDELVGAGMSGSKVRNALMPLRVLCRHLLERDELTVNPTVGVKLPRPAGRRERAETPQTAALLLAAVPEEDRALWATALYAGLRRGELRALAVSHVDLKAKTPDGDPDPTIRVERAWDEVAGFIEPKSEAGARLVPVPPILRKVLAEHIARTGRRGDDLIFGRTATSPFVATSVRKRALAAWERMNAERVEKKLPALRPLGLHEARHLYVSWLEDCGVSDTAARAFAGHAREQSITSRYRHLQPNARVEAMERFQAYLVRQNGRARRAVGGNGRPAE